MAKFIIILGVLIIGGVGVYWSGVWKSFMPQQPEPVAQQIATTTAPVEQKTPAPAAPVSDLPTQLTDASDAAMTQDAAAIDAQLQTLVSNQASIDAGLNDKQVTQEF